MKLNIDITKDTLLSKNAVDILRDRYMLPEEETPQESFARACMAFADNKALAERSCHAIAITEHAVAENRKAEKREVPS